MKHSLTYLDKILFLLLSFALVGCASRKSVNHEQQEKVEFRADERAKDLEIMEYNIDTSRVCEQSLDFERVEYYPTTYTDSAGRVVQHVKAITKKTARASNKAQGTTNAAKVEQHTDSASVKLGTEKSESLSYKERITNYWALLGIIALFIIVLCFIYKVRKNIS